MLLYAGLNSVPVVKLSFGTILLRPGASAWPFLGQKVIVGVRNSVQNARYVRGIFDNEEKIGEQ